MRLHSLFRENIICTTFRLESAAALLKVAGQAVANPQQIPAELYASHHARATEQNQSSLETLDDGPNLQQPFPFMSLLGQTRDGRRVCVCVKCQQTRAKWTTEALAQLHIDHLAKRKHAREHACASVKIAHWCTIR